MCWLKSIYIMHSYRSAFNKPHSNASPPTHTIICRQVESVSKWLTVMQPARLACNTRLPTSVKYLRWWGIPRRDRTRSALSSNRMCIEQADSFRSKNPFCQIMPLIQSILYASSHWWRRVNKSRPSAFGAAKSTFALPPAAWQLKRH